MQTKEIKQLGRALAEEFAAIIESQKCEWISEAKVLEDFPFGSKETLKALRLSGQLEFNVHWKYLSGYNRGGGKGRSGTVIYNRPKLNEYIRNI